MKLLRLTLAAVTFAAPLLFADVSAQAMRARQYNAQGHGHFVNSSGTPKRYGHGRLFGRPHHRHRMRPH